MNGEMHTYQHYAGWRHLTCPCSCASCRQAPRAAQAKALWPFHRQILSVRYWDAHARIPVVNEVQSSADMCERLVNVAGPPVALNLQATQTQGVRSCCCMLWQHPQTSAAHSNHGHKPQTSANDRNPQVLHAPDICPRASSGLLPTPAQEHASSPGLRGMRTGSRCHLCRRLLCCHSHPAPAHKHTLREHKLDAGQLKVPASRGIVKAGAGYVASASARGSIC